MLDEFALVADFDLEEFHPLDSLLGVFGEDSSEKLFGFGGDEDFRGHLELGFLQYFDQFGDGVRFEGAVSVEHFVEDDADGPNIGLVGVDLAVEDFGGHVDGGAQHGFRHLGFLETFAEAEITNFEDAIVEEDVIGLEVPMHDVVLVEDLEGFEELFEDEEGFFFLEGVFLPEEPLQSAAVAVLVDEVEVVLGFEHVVVGDDVFVFLDVGEDVNFVDGAFF